MGFNPLEVFRAVFHADLEDASGPNMDWDVLLVTNLPLNTWILATNEYKHITAS